ncbi:PKD domain-containing protein [Reichenbachiella carrageenanivorans]|uniref:PKD domain-containing protein n=1 Tax=Reichenbachiella carrageenanivorans TaxID=2979869 RepID=A0ABY6D4E8_9BACT|nr:PKD domain-containing protein [Reichenbachiella carrageenanivorans]UXX81031.1 PKD domain-containing protein [Reichenbachiella carrageenanivorans]
MDRSIVSYRWDFGDETSKTGSTTSHEFTQAGKYIVTLTVEDDQGDTDVSTTTITAVDLSLKSVIRAQITQGYTPLYASLDGSDSESPTSTIESYTWKLKGQVISEASKLAVQLSEPGAYIYELTVKDATGAEHTSMHTITALAFTGESNSYKQVLKDGMEGFSIIDPSNNGQQWGGVPSVATLASDNDCLIHYGTIWGDHASSGYDHASGRYSAFLQPTDEVLSLEGFNTAGYDHVKLQFGMMKMSIVEGEAVPNDDTGSGIKLEYSTNGTQWTEISLVGKFTYNNEVNSIWYWVELEEELPSVENLRLRFTRLADANPFDTNWRIDDILFTAPAGVVMSSPGVTISASKLGPNQLELIEVTAAIDGTASFIEWDFGAAANPQIGFGVGPHQVKFSKQGAQEIKVRVLNQMGETTAKTTIAVGPIVSALSGTIVASKSKIALSTKVMISAKLDGEAKAYTWDFGVSAEPKTATGAGPHDVIFSELGMKDIELKVTNRSGITSIIKADGLIEVSNTVVAGIDDSHIIQVFPNPATDLLQFKGFNTQINVQLWSLEGQQLMEKNIRPQETLKLNHLQPGLYLLQIRGENNLMEIQKINKL